MARKCGAKKKTQSKQEKPKYVCETCGLAITVDNECNCVEACDIICCGQPLKPKK